MRNIEIYEPQTIEDLEKKVKEYFWDNATTSQKLILNEKRDWFEIEMRSTYKFKQIKVISLIDGIGLETATCINENWKSVFKMIVQELEINRQIKELERRDCENIKGVKE